MANFHSYTKLKFWREALIPVIYTLLGVNVAIFLIIYSIISIPIFSYRWILTKYVAPCFHPNIGKAVTTSGQVLSPEFMDKTPTSAQRSSTVTRCAIICNVYCVGTILLEEMSRLISEGWLCAKPGEVNLKYPEFQQYIEMWMGFMFWKPDNNFRLENHINLHVIPKEAGMEESEEYLQNLVESLLSKKFPLKKSPWEVHLIQNYRNSDMAIKAGQNTDEAMTVILFRFHHALLDGFSMLYAMIEGLLSQDLTSVHIANPNNISSKAAGEGSACREYWLNMRKLFISAVYVPWRCLHDLGYLACLQWRFLGESQSPWYVTDRAKKWEVIYQKSELIPVEKIKMIKNYFNVSFTAVLMSCMGAAAAQCYKRKGHIGKSILPMISIVPMKNHPNKLRNHALATILEMNVTPDLDRIERLKMTERQFVNARHYSQIPFISWIVVRLFASSIAPLTKIFTKNRSVPAAITNFPGPGLHLNVLGREVPSVDFTASGLQGVCGVTFSVFSYGDCIKIAVQAEKAVMKRPEVVQLTKVISSEIETLHGLAVGKNNNRKD